MLCRNLKPKKPKWRRGKATLLFCPETQEPAKENGGLISYRGLVRMVIEGSILSCTNCQSQLTQCKMPASNGSTHAARFTDKVAIVTGGSSGMGREASLALAKGESLLPSLA